MKKQKEGQVERRASRKKGKCNNSGKKKREKRKPRIINKARVNSNYNLKN